ncbi:MEDS domain-containing protein [Kutzneria chonburiensis]|uniref:MEDS domain-containing protein n=1 Tax=Kutzneria chonburiensis TaxID=1483604 RepID=A0ABV6MRL7_9PSEU|nr:MEDS domain-containing protein [Kutzneria chonburiensis]
MARSSGIAASARGLGLHDHVCWSYDDGDGFRRRAREFLAEGLALGQRVEYIADDSADRLAADLRKNADLGQALRAGAARVVAARDLYPPDAVIEPAEQVAAYAAATEKALSDGYTGLRVAIDVTGLARKPRQREAFARYEHLIDQYMTTRPFAALCGYHRPELGEHTVAELACLHPTTNSRTAPFRLYASTDGEYSAELAGELDLMGAELFPLALRRTRPSARRGRVLLDAARVSFVDHRSLIALDDHAREHGTTVVLRTGLSTPARVIAALQLRSVRAEAAG